jgi:hypothetical protein
MVACHARTTAGRAQLTLPLPNASDHWLLAFTSTAVSALGCIPAAVCSFLSLTLAEV